jgi:phage shock protein C
MAQYCSGCGVSLPGGARFCSACGRAVIEPGPVAADFASRPASPPWGPLTRPLAGRKLAGVCRGLANQYGWDVTLTRVIAVLLAVLVFPIGLVAYALFWVMVPEEPPMVAPTTNLNITT